MHFSTSGLATGQNHDYNPSQVPGLMLTSIWHEALHSLSGPWILCVQSEGTGHDDQQIFLH